jgi:hypothetical protein
VLRGQHWHRRPAFNTLEGQAMVLVVLGSIVIDGVGGPAIAQTMVSGSARRGSA